MVFCIDILEAYFEMDDIESLSLSINEIDVQIYSLLTQRLELTKQLELLKKHNGINNEKNDNLYHRIDSQYQGRNNIYLKDIYNTILNESNRIHKEMN